MHTRDTDPGAIGIERAPPGPLGAAVLRRWRQLQEGADSDEALYQSPEFFEFLRASGAGRAELCHAIGSFEGALVGLLPLRLRTVELAFRVGAHEWGALDLPCIEVLGSVPLLPAASLAPERWVPGLFAAYPACQAISLPALPAASALHAILQDSAWLRRHHRRYLAHDWRACHRIVLPASYAAYQQQFNPKRRYNLNRQLRQLREHAGGALNLHRIEDTQQLPRLCAALAQLASPAHRAELLSDASLQAFAERGLLHSYVLECRGQACALMLGARAQRVLHLYNIFHDGALAALSPGTSILQLAIQELCEGGEVAAIDFGYGTPAHSYQSSNITLQRGHLLILRAGWRSATACALHQGYGQLLAVAKRWRRPLLAYFT
ncbi:MAG: GNAT family N-acetyltransferase [Pseudomonadota bacterium]